MTITVRDLSDLPDAAQQLLQYAGDKKVWLFYGEMGAGKTTLIKALCKEMGVEEVISSPTFALVNEYISPDGSVFHFDFYRIRTEQEALDMGYEEYFYSGHPCLVEWPEKIHSLLPPNAFAVHISLGENEERKIFCEDMQPLAPF